VRKPTIAESALNRLLNLADELDAPPVPPIGADIDAALAAPTPPLPADPALADAALLESLGLEPPR
jgi:hypothetical protein